MATSTSTSKSGGIGFLGLLAIVFITLKLTGHITWSWIWVLAPLWAPLAVVLAFFALFGLGFLIYAGFAGIANARRKSKMRKAWK